MTARVITLQYSKEAVYLVLLPSLSTAYEQAPNTPVLWMQPV